MRNTCAELQEKYGICYDTIDYLLHDELPEALPEELLTAGQRNRIRREVREATATAKPHQRSQAVVAAVTKLSEHLGLSEDAIRAVVGADGDTVPQPN